MNTTAYNVISIVGLSLLIGGNVYMWIYLYKTHINRLTRHVGKLEKKCEPLWKQMNQMSTNVLPTPNMVTLIEETIKEHLSIELALTKNNKTKFGKKMILKVSQQTERTYPFIDQRYIAEKTIAMFESMIGYDEKPEDSI